MFANVTMQLILNYIYIIIFKRWKLAHIEQHSLKLPTFTLACYIPPFEQVFFF